MKRHTPLYLVTAIVLIGASIVSPLYAHAESDAPAVYEGTSPYHIAAQAIAPIMAPADVSSTITFSEYSIGTTITNQYANTGIIFGGTTTFISRDGSNPTSPVLSGTPQFQGAIEGTFVSPSDGTTPTIVSAFKLDIGYFDAYASTRIEWFDPEGNKLGQRTNSALGIERFEISGGNIAKWRVSIVQDEPNGFAIDNVSFESVEASVLFRESGEDKIRGTWGFLEDSIPGWDHVGFRVGNLVYESHPGYGDATFVSEDGSEQVSIVDVFGVQAQHTPATFRHESTIPGAANTTLTAFEEVPVEITLANKMKSYMQEKIDEGAEFQYIDYTIPDGILTTLSPDAQKGVGDNTFTCVGLIERSAEEAGHNGGQGFILNRFESFPYVNIYSWPLKVTEIPLLSPELLNYSMKTGRGFDNARQWFQGLLDPVDFIITDPLGRRLGHTAAIGTLNEIPNAFYSGDGKVEQFFIPNPVAGIYQIEYFGLNSRVQGAFGTGLHAEAVDMTLSATDKPTDLIRVEMVANSPGDLDGDGVLTSQDVALLSSRLNTFPTGTDDPADVNGDGIITTADRASLEQLLTLPRVGVNTAPQAHADTFSFRDVSGSVELDVLANDNALPDTGEVLQVSAVGTPSNGGGVQIGANGTLMYTPRADFVGQETVEYVLHDGNGGFATAVATILVERTASPPVLYLPYIGS
jgi:hypothetical protein